MRILYAIRDRVAQDLLSLHMYTVITFRTNEQAARYFADGINDNTSLMHKHPGDYELIRVGSIDDDGNLTPSKPEVIITGDALIALQTPTLVKEQQG